jgi:hypothetical protein
MWPSIFILDQPPLLFLLMYKEVGERILIDGINFRHTWPSPDSQTTHYYTGTARPSLIVIVVVPGPLGVSVGSNKLAARASRDFTSPLESLTSGMKKYVTRRPRNMKADRLLRD